MRVNYTTSVLTWSGGIRTIYEITRRLVERNHSVSVTVIEKVRAQKDYPWNASIIEPPSWKVILNKIIFKKFFRNMPCFLSIGSELLRRAIPDCDINIATDILSAFPVYRSQKGVLFHHMQHDETIFFSDPYLKILSEEGYFLPFDVRIANSTWLKNRLKEKYGIESVLINHSIAGEIFYPRKVERNKNRKRIVSLGKTPDWKGFRDLLEAMKIVMKKAKKLEWIVYGNHRDLPRDSEAPYIFVYFPSDVELAEIYSSADVVVCPSWFESFPAPPLEAMACGAPVVTTQYGTEDYAVDGKNALVIPPRNPQIMAESILRVLDDEELARRLKEGGIETSKQFTWDKTTDRIERLFFEKLKK